MTSLAPASPPSADLRRRGGAAVRSSFGEHDDAARVLAAGVVGGVDGLARRRASLGVDDEGQHAAEGDRAALVALVEQPLVDVAGVVGVGQAR